MKLLHIIGFILVVVGGINWGLVGAYMLLNNGMMGWNVVNMLLGSWPMVEAVVYVLVGLSAIWMLAMHPKECTVCRSGGM